jgi:hypothetical protein
MPPINPQSERAQFARVYPGMPDAQLADLAEQAYTLTGLVREALIADLEKRGLNVSLADSAPDESCISHHCVGIYATPLTPGRFACLPRTATCGTAQTYATQPAPQARNTT